MKEKPLMWCHAEGLPGQRYPVPSGWAPERGVVFFTLSQNGPVLFPFVRVGMIAGVPVPHGPGNEFPMGCYALADLDGRVEFVGAWETELAAAMRDHIARLRLKANGSRDNVDSPAGSSPLRVLH